MKTETTPKAETESRTRIQAYSKSQLAGLYLPHIQSALLWLAFFLALFGFIFLRMIFSL